MRSHPRLRLVLASAGLLAPAAVYGQAFGLNEIGSCAIARAYATTASPCRDASTIYWNSAAATWINGWSLSVSAASIAVKGSFTQDTTGKKYDANVPTKIVPNAFINYHPADSKLALGLGFYVPYGLTSQWNEDFPGRFSALKAALATYYIQPNIAWQINKAWSIGGGPVFGHSDVELIQGVDLSLQKLPTGATFGQIGIASGTEFARARLKGSATAYGAQIAIAGHLDNWSVGARFLSPLEFNYNNADATFTQIPTGLIVGGDLPGPTPATSIKAGTPVDAIVAPEFAAGGPLTSQKASTHITHPAQIQAGVAYSGYKNWLLEADYAFVGYKRFGNLPVTFPSNPTLLNANYIEDYNNSSAIRIGAEYTIPTDGWKLRAGFAGVASAAPPETVTPLLPEQDRTYYTAGVGIPLFSMLALDASYARVSTPGARGRIVERTSESQTAAQLNSGLYNLSANVFSLTLKATF